MSGFIYPVWTEGGHLFRHSTGARAHVLQFVAQSVATVPTGELRDGSDDVVLDEG